MQSGFRKIHSTVIVATRVLNDIINAIDSKEYCVALFLDLTKAFDTVDHSILLLRLADLGFSAKTLKWFENYLSGRKQCVKVDGLSSEFLIVQNGVPQGSILGPILFIIYVNDLCENINDANCHFYADDTIIYTSSSSLEAAINKLQAAFNVIQRNLCTLRLVLNVNRTKMMRFSRSKSQSQDHIQIITLKNEAIKCVHIWVFCWMKICLLINILIV